MRIESPGFELVEDVARDLAPGLGAGVVRLFRHHADVFADVVGRGDLFDLLFERALGGGLAGGEAANAFRLRLRPGGKNENQGKDGNCE